MYLWYLLKNSDAECWNSIFVFFSKQSGWTNAYSYHYLGVEKYSNCLKARLLYVLATKLDGRKMVRQNLKAAGFC